MSKYFSPKIALGFSLFWLILVFLFNKHYVDLLESAESWFVSKGLIYYKDFNVYHFPLGKIIMLPIHQLTSWNFEISPFVGLFIGFVSLLLIYKFGEKFFSQTGTAMALLFFSFIYWYTATQILYYHTQLLQLFLLAAVYLYFIIGQDKKLSNYKLFFLGILISFTELSQQLASFTVLIMSIFAIGQIIEKSLNLKKLTIYILVFLSGEFFPFLIFSLYFYFNDALYDFYKWNVPYYFTYSDSPTAGIFPLDKISILYAPVLLLIIFSLFLKGERKMTSTLAIFALTTLPFIILGVFHWYHITYALPLLALCVGQVFSINKLPGFLRALRYVLIFVILSFFFLTIVPWHISQKTHPSLKINNDAIKGDAMYDAVQWTKMNTSPKSKIMVVGNSIFYIRSDRLPSSRPNRGIVYAWEPFNEVKIELLQSPPDYWVIADAYVRRMVPDYGKTYMVDFINQQLRDCYKLEYKNSDWAIWGKDLIKACYKN